MSKDDIIRFRCEGDLKARFEAVAKLERREPSDLARIVLEDYIAAQECKLNSSLGKPLALADAPASPAPSPAIKPITYITKRRK